MYESDMSNPNSSIVHTLHDDSHESSLTTYSVSALWAENDRLHRALDECKGGISEHFRNRKWDRFKKLCNEHELVHTSTLDRPSMSAACPISRSYFKLWEAMRAFPGAFAVDRPTPVRAVFLAEGPGGFVEAFMTARAARAEADELFGMTLISPTNRNVPEWKISSNLRVCAGADGTGNLYNPLNADCLAEGVGAASADIVTADGGFDFSVDYSQQERMSLRLIAAEVYCALRVQATGGTLFLKVFDLRLPETIIVLGVLARNYAQMSIFKPMMSRPANSEKYVVCTAFRGASDLESLRVLREFVEGGDAHRLAQLSPNMARMIISPATSNRLDDDVVSPTMLYKLVRANSMLTVRQACGIRRTLRAIAEYEVATEERRRQLFHELHVRQVVKSFEWCARNDVDISKEAATAYASILHLKVSGMF